MTSWDRKQGEPMMWYSRFMLFRELGPERTLMAAYRAWRVDKGAEGRSVTSVARPWLGNSSKWAWKQRAEAWDYFQQVRRMALEQEEIDAMNKRHLQAALGLQSAGTRGLQAIIDELRRTPTEDDPRPVRQLTPAEVKMFLGQGIDLERTTRGLPTEMIRIMGMSDEELLKAHRDRRSAPRSVDRRTAGEPGAAGNSDGGD